MTSSVKFSPVDCNATYKTYFDHAKFNQEQVYQRLLNAASAALASTTKWGDRVNQKLTCTEEAKESAMAKVKKEFASILKAGDLGKRLESVVGRILGMHTATSVAELEEFPLDKKVHQERTTQLAAWHSQAKSTNDLLSSRMNELHRQATRYLKFLDKGEDLTTWESGLRSSSQASDLYFLITDAPVAAPKVEEAKSEAAAPTGSPKLAPAGGSAPVLAAASSYAAAAGSK